MGRSDRPTDLWDRMGRSTSEFRLRWVRVLPDTDALLQRAPSPLLCQRSSRRKSDEEVRCFPVTDSCLPGTSLRRVPRAVVPAQSSVTRRSGSFVVSSLSGSSKTSGRGPRSARVTVGVGPERTLLFLPIPITGLKYRRLYLLLLTRDRFN